MGPKKRWVHPVPISREAGIVTTTNTNINATISSINSGVVVAVCGETEIGQWRAEVVVGGRC